MNINQVRFPMEIQIIIFNNAIKDETNIRSIYSVCKNWNKLLKEYFEKEKFNISKIIDNSERSFQTISLAKKLININFNQALALSQSSSLTKETHAIYSEAFMKLIEENRFDQAVRFYAKFGFKVPLIDLIEKMFLEQKEDLIGKIFQNMGEEQVISLAEAYQQDYFSTLNENSLQIWKLLVKTVNPKFLKVLAIKRTM